MSLSYCHLCGNQIPGQPEVFRHPKWVANLSLKVCPRCAHVAPRCRNCGLPMLVNPPNAVCETCCKFDRFCSACGRLLKQEFVQFDGVRYYCGTCNQQRIPCDVCGAPTTDERWRLSDGRLTCAYCHTDAIYRSSEASAIYDEMRVVIESSLHMRLNVPTGIALVDQTQLGEIIKNQKGLNLEQAREMPDLDPEHTLGLYARRGIRRGIYIQTGLPKMLFLQVAAHEFAHAWQGENCPVLSDVILHEGFAEWVSYHVLGAYGYSYGQERLHARADIYGRGLKRVLDIEARHGIDGVFRACRSSA